MPRHGQAPSANIRNRYRINNKSRLKVIRGSIDTDPIVLDEDEEKNRLLQSVAGVDQEDANEHHLQAVLSAAALQNSTTCALEKEKQKQKEKEESAPAIFIPVPDSTGRADNHEQLYPPNKHMDTACYVQSTYTVEDLFDASLANGFSYVMDERDMEWLTKNNEEARGEGTSAQGAVSGTRASSRSARAKGKEPDAIQPVVISEDEFELVMGLYEKVTHEKTEFLHHSLETGMTFPPFTDYQDTFSSPLPPATFVSFTPPSWLPLNAQLSQMARAVYPYWKERKLERGGRRIIPIVNLDESDTLNESYICFRRRDVKTARKTRASQVSSYDKLARLQSDFSSVLQLANLVLQREEIKRESSVHSQLVWEQRKQLVEARVKCPTVAEKGDDELLIERERPSRKSEATRVKIPPKPEAQSANRAQFISPKDRYENYQSRIENALRNAKESDQPWEDVTDTGYIQPPTAYSSRLFKYITPPDTPRSPSPDVGEGIGQNVTGDGHRERRSVRLRFGRGGRRFVDRRPPMVATPAIISQRKRPRETEEEEDEERDRRLRARWRFDPDDSPPCDPKTVDEQDREVVNEYDVAQMRHSINLMHESDYAFVLNDPTLTISTVDGQKRTILPFRPSLPSAYPVQQYNMPRQVQTVLPAPTAPQPNAAAAVPASSRPGVYIPVSSTQKNLVENAIPRAGENSALTSPSREAPIPDLTSKPVPISTLSTQSQLFPQTTQPVVNGVARPAINVPYIVKAEPVSPQRPPPQSSFTQSEGGGVDQKPTIFNGVAQPTALVNGHNSNMDKAPSTTSPSSVSQLPTVTDMKIKLPPIRQAPKTSGSPVSRGGLPVTRPPSSLGGNAKVN